LPETFQVEAITLKEKSPATQYFRKIAEESMKRVQDEPQSEKNHNYCPQIVILY